MEKPLMNIGRKTLLALAVGSLMSPAMAANIADFTDDRVYGAEYLGMARATDTVPAGALAVELGAEYTTDDQITLTFSGAALDPTSLPTSVNVPAASPLKGITLGLLNANASQATYRVTAILGPTEDSTVGLVVPFFAADDLDFNAQEVLNAGSVVVSFSAQTSAGAALDTGGGSKRSVEYLDVANQFAAEVTLPFDAIINVEADRKQFVPNTGFDQLSIALTNNTGLAGFADWDTVTVTVNGNFSWVTDTNANQAGIQPAAGVIQATNCIAPTTITATTITLDCVVAQGTATLFLVPGNQAPLTILPPGPFTASVEVEYSTANFGGQDDARTTLNNASAGRWGLNGAQVFVPYMPYGANISQIIYASNTGLQTGEVTVEVIDQFGNVTPLGVVATIGPTTTQILTGAIINALPANLRNGGRLAMTITVNAPASDIKIYSAYNVGGVDRGFVQNYDVN
jgi:hypothetical protein